MQPHEVCNLLTRQISRGGKMFKTLWLVSSGCCGVAFLAPGGRPWAVAALLASILFLVGWVHMRGRYLSAWNISENPQLVYWAHPSRTKDHLVSYEDINNCQLLTLHLRDGTQFLARLSAEDMRDFIAWLNERNPSVRWGASDDIGSTAKEKL